MENEFFELVFHDQKTQKELVFHDQNLEILPCTPHSSLSTIW